MEITIKITPEMIAKVREANPLCEDDAEALEIVQEFAKEINTPDGMAVTLENLDFFNY